MLHPSCSRAVYGIRHANGPERAHMFGLTPKPIRIIKRYVDAVNAGNADVVADMMSPDCRYVDSSGRWIDGRENVRLATTRFFELEKNFRIRESSMVLHDGDVLIRGTVTADDPVLAQDTLWLARVKDGKVSYWQSFGKGLPVSLTRILVPDAAQEAMAA